ncbi:cytochrome p-450 [Diaporthe eres]|nr:cytochrome p-450 [Diaporthe eres]
MAATLTVVDPVRAYLPSVSSSSIFMGVLLLLISRLIVINVVYNLFFHPLSSYPGPKLWATSRLPWNYFNFRGRLGWRIRDLHNQYGPVVRIAPNELSYTTPSAWKKIYGQRSPEFEKAVDGRGIAPVEINGKRALMTETSEGHARLRKAINPAFSERAVRDQEKYLQAHSDTLVTQLLKSCKQGPVDLAKWFNLLSYDADQPHLQVLGNRAKSVVFFQFALQYGLMSVLQFLTPKYAREARRKHLALSAAKVQARLQAKNPGKDFMYYILENQEEQFSSLDLTLLASTFIVAGSNTTADTMTASAVSPGLRWCTGAIGFCSNAETAAATWADSRVVRRENRCMLNIPVPSLDLAHTQQVYETAA